MIYPVAALVLLGLLLGRSHVVPAIKLRMSSGFPEKALSVAAVLAALLVLLRGNMWAALILFGVGLWLLGRATRLGEASRVPHPISRLRSAMIEMEYDHRRDAMSGMVIAGPLEGMLLDRLTREACDDLYRRALRDDADGARLLEAYLDRRFAGWRRTGDRHEHARTGGVSAAGGMSEEEAYEVLGLRRGATREDIVRSHRAVMKKWHPDQGGSADLAARANEAKEVLLRRHA